MTSLDPQPQLVTIFGRTLIVSRDIVSTIAGG